MAEPAPARTRLDVALGIAQAAVYVALVAEGLRVWPIAAGLLALAALAQVVGAVRGGRAVAIAGMVSIGAVAAVVGMHAQAVIHVARAFHPLSAPQAWESLGGVLLALPWAIAVPIAQVVRGRSGRGASIAAVALVPVLAGLVDGRADTAYAPVDGAAVAAWAWARATGATDGPPEGPGPVLVVVSAFEGGRVRSRAVLRGDDLADALRPFDVRIGSGAEPALLVEVAVAEGPLPTLWLAPYAFVARPGDDGLSSADAVVGAREAWQGDLVSVRAGLLVVPALRPDPAADLGRWTRYSGFVASAAGVTPLDQGWAASPPLDADTARDAAIAGGAMIARGLRDDGRYAYVVHGPEGRVGSGYNFPRHAGATWFLAQVCSREPSLRPALDRGLEFLRTHTTAHGDMAWVLDPDRDDGLVWVGTTALALLAVLEADGPTPEAARYAAFVAASVDPEGRVRGDYDLAAGAYLAQPEVTYAQGQALLALSAAKAAGLPVDASFERASEWSDHGYRPGNALFSLDDHWGCLAALAAYEASGRAAGQRACDTYLATVRKVPVAGAPVQPAAGPAAAVAEAWIARALLAERTGESGPWAGIASAYGRSLVAQQYRSADAPFLGEPTRLLGGFRDRPWDLDVRVDSVQHIGSALLGLERLLRARERDVTHR